MIIIYNHNNNNDIVRHCMFEMRMHQLNKLLSDK
jgi:hypothetical protein